MRIYQATLLEDFATRGGRVVIDMLQANDLTQLAEKHDLLVVAAGRDSLVELFPRQPERSPFDQPQRRLVGAFYRGLGRSQPPTVVYNIAPGHGEIFSVPFHSMLGPMSNILIEAVPGQALEPITRLRYEDDPQRFNTTVLELLREHAPPLYDLIDKEAFGVTRAQDIIQGAITPTVRRGYAQLGSGKFVLALGDVHILNDPVLGQGANLASRCAFLLGEALLAAGAITEEFCQKVEQRLWEAGQAATMWTNATLQPPLPHAVQVLAAAAQSRTIADEISDNFNNPERNWEIFVSAEGAARFLQRHSLASRTESVQAA
jgi:2-polyprenyl-6-methoxyphenol hydroxylase-like FAD-dependent oxidoreductase